MTKAREKKKRVEKVAIDFGGFVVCFVHRQCVSLVYSSPFRTTCFVANAMLLCFNCLTSLFPLLLCTMKILEVQKIVTLEL